MIEEIVTKYIKDKNLFTKADKIIVGLSGGADSVALLILLKDLGYSCIAAHCNFHLRGEEADRDEDFVVQLCKKLDIKLRSTHFDTYKYAADHKLSIEMAARELRYNWFERLCKEENATKVAIAHHRDDNVETLLLNLIRGAGLKGLTGIQPKNGNIVRPLLTISRKEIVFFLQSRQQDFVTDSTNLEDEFARNKVRLNIIPTMEQINSACLNNIQNTIEYLNQVQLIYTQSISNSINRVKSENIIDCGKLLKEVSPETILYEICYPLGFNSKQIQDIFESISSNESKEFHSEQYYLIKNRDRIIIYSKETDHKECIKPQLQYTIKVIDKDFKIPRTKEYAVFDADLINIESLSIRKWKQGDSFIPFGMIGRKNLSDFFTDNKFTLEEKENQWLLIHNQDIIWVIGQRTDNRYRVTKESKRALIISQKAKKG